jgi:hypothetical protein
VALSSRFFIFAAFAASLAVILLSAASPAASALPEHYLQGLPAGPAAPFPQPALSEAETALTVDGIPYPTVILEGYLEFTRSQAAAAGQAGRFYEWGEILHLYDTAEERILAARAAWHSGLRVSAADLNDFSRHTIEADPAYLEEIYRGSYDLFVWDAQLQILSKKWMSQVALGRGDLSWTEAGRFMTGDPELFVRWEAWLGPARDESLVLTYPERLRRQGGAPVEWGRLLLLLALGGAVGLALRAAARRPGSGLLPPGGWADWALQNRLYPEGARALFLAAFLLVIGALLLGPADPHANLGSVYLWILWWPLVPFALFLAARSWCAVCPVATLGDLVQRIPGTARRRPRRLALAGLIIVDASFLLVTWLDRAAGLVSSVRLTLAAVLLLTTAAVAVSLLYTRRTFCRHLCFFGALGANYSLASVVELRPQPGLCRGCTREPCFRRSSGDCPLLEQPRALRSNRDCNLCLDCVRRCSRRSLSLRLRDPLSELASVARPRLGVAVLAALLVGVVAVQNLGMLEVAGVWERRLGEATGLGSTGVASVVYLSALLLPLLLLAVAAGFDAGRLALYGYALIPLDLGAHASHNLLHLLGEGKTIWWVTAGLVGLSSPLDIPGGHPGGSFGAALLAPGTIKGLQVTLLLLGGTAGLAVARRFGRRRSRPVAVWPLYLLLGLLLLVNLWLLAQPMALRH